MKANVGSGEGDKTGPKIELCGTPQGNVGRKRSRQELRVKYFAFDVNLPIQESQLKL